jgi:hypothetical protein
VVNLRRNPEDETQADLTSVLDAVTNPLPISGVDPEDAAVIKQIAPEAFRAVTFRAVRPEDYAEIAERLPGVQRASALPLDWQLAEHSCHSRPTGRV